MSDDEGPPPLEDMSEHVNKLINKNKLSTYNDVKVFQPTSTDTSGDCSKKVVETYSADKKYATSQPKKPVMKTTGYAGMRKGFLSGGLSSPQKKEKKPAKITELKANPQAKVDGLKLKEVQNKMDEANKFLSDNSNEWLSDDLLRGITSNDKINSKLNNPQFMAAFAEFQSNPEQAARKYGDNSEMKEFIQEFSGLMGSHFTQLADKQAANK